MGMGELGQALSKLLKSPAVALECWDVDDKRCRTKKPLAKILEQAEVVFFCVPSWNLRKAAGMAKPDIKKGVLAVTVSKGVERGTGYFNYQIVEEVLPDNPAAILAGPMIAEELLAGKVGAATVACHSAKIFKKIKTVFDGSGLLLETSEDLRGTAAQGVLKNVYAMIMGMTVGLRLGHNAQGIIFNQSLREMNILNRLLGGKEAAAYSFAGLPDYMATAFSADSTNHQVGVRLAQGKKASLHGEGLNSTNFLFNKAKRRMSALPLLAILHKVLIGKGKAAALFNSYLVK